MERPVDQLSSQNEDLLSIAATHARDIDALCTDVAAIIFPTAIHPPTDAMTTAVSTRMVGLVSDIESQLLGISEKPNFLPATWTLLADSGFLREAALVDFVLARVSEDRLDSRLGSSNTTLTADLLDHPDGNVAEAAQLLLAANSLHRRSRGGSYLTLPPELLHKLCWRVVAAIEVLESRRSPAIIAAARQLINGYDESQTTASSARKIVHFLGTDYLAELLDPEKSGLDLFVAKVSAEVNLDHDHILRLIDCNSSIPSALIMAALGLPKDVASARLLLLRGQLLTSREGAIFDRHYDSMERQTAIAEISSWSASRASYLAFGNI
jgi:hypothetical protein